MKIALVYNLIRPELLHDRPVDSIAELDTPETICAMRTAIAAGGHEVMLIEADEKIFRHLKSRRERIDLVFNIAEGLQGESRESQVPMMCEALDIPYTGSGPLTLALCLNKARTKEVLRYHHIRTPNFQLLTKAEAKLNKKLKYPLIVKLNEEGSSKGLDYDSVVRDEAALRKKARFLLATYPGSLLVEEYIAGREFSVPVLGNSPPAVLPIVELVFDKVPPGRPHINLFYPDDPVLELLHVLHRRSPSKQLNHTTVCPAQVDKGLEKRIRRTALRAFHALGMRDWGRMEFRLDRRGKLYLLELNPIAGIDPTYLLPRSAQVYGLDYAGLLNRIIDEAQRRYAVK